MQLLKDLVFYTIAANVIALIEALAGASLTVIIFSALLIPPLLLLVLITAVRHQGAHFVSALILGIPIAYFNWFDPSYFAPVIVPSSIENTFGMQIVSSAGGIITGTLLLGVLILKRDWFKQSL